MVPSLAYSVTNSLVPTLSLAHARGDRESFRRYWHDSMIKVAEIIMPVFFFFLLLAGPAIRVLFSASFEAAVIPFRVYLLVLPLRLCSYGAVLRSLGETRAVFTSAIAALAANLILILPLYYLLGLAGPAVAAVIGQLVIISMLLVRIRAALDIHWSELLPYRPLRKTILTAGVSALPLLGLSFWQAPDGLRLLIGVATMVPLYSSWGTGPGSSRRKIWSICGTYSLSGACGGVRVRVPNRGTIRDDCGELPPMEAIGPGRGTSRCWRWSAAPSLGAATLPT